MSITQLEGDIKFGMAPNALTDYSNELTQILHTGEIQTVDRPATFGNAKPESVKSGLSDAIAVGFLDERTIKEGSFARLCWKAQRDDSTTTGGRRPGELYFSARFKPSTEDGSYETNPELHGWVLVGSLDTGGTVGEVKAQTKNWAARDVELIDEDES